MKMGQQQKRQHKKRFQKLKFVHPAANVVKLPVFESPMVVVIPAAANRTSRSMADMLWNQNRSLLTKNMSRKYTKFVYE